MAQVKSSLEVVEEWKKKCFDFYTQSDDVLASTMYKLLDASSMILKGSDSSRIQRALGFLEYERSQNMLSENTKARTIRTMMYGVLQSTQGTLMVMTSSTDSKSSKEIQADKIYNSKWGIAQVKSSLEIVKEWKRKCFDFYDKTDDVLASTMLKLLDASSAILKEFECSRIQRALAFLEYERSLNMISENTEEPTIRTMMFGVLQSVHGTLLDMTSSKVLTLSKETQSDEIPNSSPSLPSKPSEEHVEGLQSMPNNNQVKAEDLMTFKEKDVTGDNVEQAEKKEDDSPSLNGVSMVPNFTPPCIVEPKKEPKEIKEEETLDDLVIPNDNELPIKPIEESVDEIQDFANDNQVFGDFDPIIEEEKNDITSNMEELNETAESQIGGEDSSAENSNEKEDVEKGKPIDKSKKLQKKRKSSNKGTSETESAKKKPRGMNATELECPECEYRTRSVRSWEKHLKTSHSTTPTLAGLALLCDCGIESRSAKHIRKCDIANFAVIRNSDAKLTPQCLLCEKFPKTIAGYITHLHRDHNSTLKMNDFYLKCSCGFDVFSYDIKRIEHGKKCDGCEFTLHKLDKK